MPKIILIVTLILIILILGAITILKPQTSTEQNEATSPPTLTPKPQAFGVKTIDPASPDLVKIAHITPIKVTFNLPINPSSFTFEIEPPVEVTVVFDRDSIIFKPKETWPFDQEITFTITAASSISGIPADSSYKFIAKSPLPTE